LGSKIKISIHSHNCYSSPAKRDSY